MFDVLWHSCSALKEFQDKWKKGSPFVGPLRENLASQKRQTQFLGNKICSVPSKTRYSAHHPTNVGCCLQNHFCAGWRGGGDWG